MQICGYDALPIKFSSYSCHDIVSYYDSTLTSLLTYYNATSDFYLRGMHDTANDTPMVVSFMLADRLVQLLPNKFPRTLSILSHVGAYMSSKDCNVDFLFPRDC
jgi:hypothetical protein